MMEGWELLESTMVLQWRFSNGTPSSLLSLLRSFRAGGTMSQSSPRSSVFPYFIVLYCSCSAADLLCFIVS